MAAVLNTQLVYNEFNITRWHGAKKPPAHTYCVMEFPTELGRVQIFVSESSRHAEVKMIEELKKRLDKLWAKGASAPTPVRIRVYMNYSPCSDELEHCIDMYKDRNIIIYFDIVAACPDEEVSRPSCDKRWAQCSSTETGCGDSQPNDNQLGIFNKTPQLSLRAFNKDDWQMILPAFLKAAENKIENKKKDKVFEAIKDGNYKSKDKKNRSRELQDLCTKYDFSKHAPKPC